MATILSVNNNLDPELRALGHTVVSVSLGEHGVYSCKQLWQESELYPNLPDFFIQKEALSVKVFFSDVHEFRCKTALWSIDTHLHYSWLMYYARLFDVFFTPHKAFLQHLAPEWQHPQMHRLAQNGYVRNFVPHTQRSHNLNFVGRLSGTRFFRQKLCQLLLERYGMHHEDNVSFSEMMNLYDNTRIIPNESMANEVNFRLMEGASCGACVISPNVGEDQDSLFKPGEEFLIYNNFTELTDIIDECLKKPEYCEAIGKRALERVQNEHLPIHRAQDLYDMLNEKTILAREKAYAKDMTQFALFLLLFTYVEDNQELMKIPVYSYEIASFELIQKLFNALRYSKDNKEGIKENVFAVLEQASMCLMRKDAPNDNAAIIKVIENIVLQSNKMLAIACGGAALYYEDASLSYFFLRLHQKLCELAVPPLPQNSQALNNQDLVAETALLWVEVLIRERKECLAGSDYISGCCRTALDFANLLQALYPDDGRWVAAIVHLKRFWSFFPREEKERIEKMLQQN